MKNKIISKTLLASAVSAALSSIVLSVNVQAQGAAAALMDEVVVTARKRSTVENAQDIPVAITAFGEAQLDAMYIKDLTDLSFTMPSVQTDEVGTFPGVQNFTIRGQGINSSIPSVDPTVGVFIDGMYLGVSYGSVMDMFDMESIEVLRGPQGLLFGRNVTGGALVMRTARPDGEFGYKIRTRVSTGLEKNVAASIEGSLVDGLAAKLTVYHNKDDGYWKNTTNTAQTDPFWASQGITPIDPNARSNPASGGNAGERTNKFARGTLVWDATDALELTLIGETGTLKGDGAVWTTRESVENGSMASDETAQDENGFTDMEWNQLVLEANWDVGAGVITNILGYRDVEALTRSDIDALSAPLFNVAGATEQDQISNELRYAFVSDDGKWDVTTGLYYFEQDVKYREERWVGAGALLMTPLPTINTVSLGGDMNHKTWGVFGSTDYSISDAVTLTAGLRYTKEQKNARVVNPDFIFSGGAPCQYDPTFASCQFDQLGDTWKNWTPKVGADWQLSEAVTLYASYTKGFRSGGVNFRNALPAVVDPGPTKEEEQNAFELGFKSDLADGRLRLNGALYHVQISDMQREINVGFSDFPALVGNGVMVWQATLNAGDVDITGAELDFVGLVTDNFAITGSLGYVESEYKSYSQQVQMAEAIIGTRLIGEDLPRLSPFTGSIGMTYDIPMGESGTVTLRGNYGYRDGAAYNDSNTERFRSKRMSNASIQWSSGDGHWVASLFGKNLNDEVQWGSLNSLLETSGGATKGRSYGAEVTYTY